MNNRNHSIDILKFLAATMVVIVHSVGWAAHSIMMPAARCAVPCFFMISGFLLYNPNGIGHERLARNVRHIAGLCAWALPLCLVADVIVMLYTNTLHWPNMFYFIAANYYPYSIGGHLWYLFAYLYVLLIVMFVDKHRLWKCLFAAAPLLLTAYFWLQLHGGPMRNFLVEGLPYFTIGAFVKKWRTRTSIATNVKFCWGGVIFFLSTSYIEAWLTGDLFAAYCRESFFSTPLLALFLLLTALSVHKSKPNWLSRLGSDYSVYIYIFHTFFIRGLFPFVNHFLPKVWLQAYAICCPFIAIALCIALTYVLKRMKWIK